MSATDEAPLPSKDLPASPAKTAIDAGSNDSPSTGSETSVVEETSTKSEPKGAFSKRIWMILGALVAVVAVSGILAVILAFTLPDSSDSSSTSSSSARSGANSMGGNSDRQINLDENGNVIPAPGEPTGTPSFPPSKAPTEVPSAAPSPAPSFSSAPSTIPSSSPSDSMAPSESPSRTPTTSPTLSPTRRPIPDNYKFHLKLYWERAFFWQEEDVERRWCLECTTCRTLTSSGEPSGCRDSNNNSGTDCKLGDQLWLQNCNGWQGSRGNVEFEIVRHPTLEADQIKIADKDLCLELVRGSNKLLWLQPCEMGEIRQLFTGFVYDELSILRPYQLTPDGIDRCVSQHHHPKKYEMLYLETCNLAEFWDTAYWQQLPV